MMRCVASGCEGFVSTGYKCGLCSVNVCKECHTVKADGHVCDPDAVASVATLKRESRPCPKCAAPISKIDGCDQMWCTHCKTAFSWRTGALVTGALHNPHYFQWMRDRGLTPARIDAPAACGRFDTDAILGAIRAQLSNHAIFMQIRHKAFALIDLLHSMAHIRANALRFNRVLDEEAASRHKLRVQRLVGEITEAVWKRELQKLEKASLKNRQWQQLFEMFVNCCGDIVTVESVNTVEKLTNTCTALTTLVDYVQAEAAKICKLFDCVPHLDLKLIEASKPNGLPHPALAGAGLG